MRLVYPHFPGNLTERALYVQKHDVQSPCHIQFMMTEL